MHMTAPWSRVSFTVLDILLVALIIYEVLVMIRGTRAAPMLAGLAAVAAAFLSGANWRIGYVELAGQPFAALCGVCVDCGVSVGDPACVVGCGAAGQLFARAGGGGGFV